MAGRRELGLPKTSVCSIREQAAKVILRNVRSQGHTYIELREEGKKFIFFCTLCLAPCYSDTVLFDHLKGILHTERLSVAKVTLFGKNPWPFSDGVLFFTNSVENEKQLVITNGNQNRLLESHVNNDNLAIVKYGENLKGSDGVCMSEELTSVHSDDANNMNISDGDWHVVIPDVLVKDVKSALEVRFIGFGQIAARFGMKDGKTIGISKIWCEWLGKKDASEDIFKVPEHDFSIVTFSYSYDLGRKGLFEDVKLLLSSSPTSELENEESARNRKRSFSDQEDTESLSNQCESHGKDSSASDGATSRLLFDRYDDQLLDTRFISSKAARRQLRRQQRVAAERMCDICQHKMLLGKDVACLLNTKTGKLACSSRNVNGAFHVYHTSCLIQWILLCEYEMYTNLSSSPKVRRRSRRKNGANGNNVQKDNDTKATQMQICSVFCPECQGTGIDIEGNELERPNISLSKMFRYKIKLSDARRAWMKSPEVLENCSTGFHFPNECEGKDQEKVSPLRLLHFYCVDE